MSLTHKNRKKLRYDSLTDTFKNACLMILMSATLYERNLIKISINFEIKLVLFPGIDLKTTLQLMTRRHEQYVIWF